MPDLFDQYQYKPKNKSVNAIICEFEKEYLEIFELAKTKWNHSIRDFHRDATGLKLSRGLGKGRSMNIIIRFFPDCNDEFIRIIDQYFPELDFLEYLKTRALNSALEESTRYFNKDIVGKFHYSLKTHCQKYLKKYNLKNIQSLLFLELGKSKDIFGAYFYKDSRIELYYVPLILFSQLNEIDLEHLIVIILAHELAHAYHHIGLDTDGISWINMSDADLGIKEGLAQYYTALYIQEQKNLYPRLETTYLKLLEFQTGPYRVHESWLKSVKKEHVKHAFNVARRNGISKNDKFEDILKQAREQLK
jgi:hypothetical protein